MSPHRRVPGARIAAATVVALVLGLAAISSAPSLAQSTDGAKASIVVTGLSTMVGPGLLEPDAGEEVPLDLNVRVLVSNDGAQPLEGLRLAVEVFAHAPFRSVVHTALDGNNPSADLSLGTSEVIDIRSGLSIGVGDAAGVAVSLPGSQMPWTRSRNTGVYPVRLTVLNGTEELDQLTTAVIYLGTAPAAAIQTLLVWPLDTAPWRAFDGTYPADAAQEIAPGGRLERSLSAIERFPEVSVLLVPAPHVLEDVADRADGFSERYLSNDGFARRAVESDAPDAVVAADFLSRLRVAVANTPSVPLSSAYARADVAGLVASPDPLGLEAATVMALGRATFESVLGVSPDRTTYALDVPMTRDGLDILYDAGVRQVIAPWSAVEFEGNLSTYPELPPTIRSLTTTRGRRLTAVVTDPYLDDAVAAPDQDHGPIVAAQRVLADTIALWAERPNATDRALALMLPAEWDVDPRLPEELLRSLSTAPWLRLTSPDDEAAVNAGVFAPEQFRSGVLAPRAEGLPPALATNLIQARRELAGARDALLDQDAPIGGIAFEDLDRALLRASSWWLRSSGGTSSVAAVQSAIDDAFGSIAVASGAQITLTSETGTIPITLRRVSGEPIRVAVELISSSNLRWPAGQTRDVELTQTGAQTLSFDVKALTTGTFQVRVRVTEPGEGGRVLAEGTIPVRSTAISRPALAGTAIVVIALLAIGAVRRREPRLEVVTASVDKDA